MGQNQAVSWSASVSLRVGKNIQRTRKLAAMSAQQLSNACEQIGHPIPRSTIANIESGRKETVSLQELMVIAHALDVPPVTLIYFPFDAAEEVLSVPGHPVLSVDAVEAFTFGRAGASLLGNLGEKTMILRGMEESASAIIERINALRAGSILPEAASRGTRNLDDESMAELAQQEADSLENAVATLLRKASLPRKDLVAAGVEVWDIPGDLAEGYLKAAGGDQQPSS